MNKYIYIVFIVLSCFSCKEKAVNNTYSYMLKETDKDIVLRIDSVTSNYSRGVNFYTDLSTGIDYLSMENDQTNELNVYKLDTPALVNKIKIQLTGPDAAGRLSGHVMNTLNDIFIFDSNRYLVCRIDRDGHVIEKFRTQSDEEALFPLSARSVHNRSIIKKDSCLYFVQDHLDYDLDMKGFNKSRICMEYDLKEKRAKSLPLTYGDFFNRLNNLISSTKLGSLYDGENFIYTFKFYDDVMITKDHKHTRFYKITSRYMKPTTDRADYSSVVNQIKYYCEKPSYGGMIYDKYRKVYYRFAFLPTEVPTDENVNDLITECCRPFSIIIINSKFEVIGETLFPKDTYVPSMSFVDKNGLNISKSNYRNPSYNDDVLTFECFEVVKN